jgi:hypothetical protein
LYVVKLEMWKCASCISTFPISAGFFLGAVLWGAGWLHPHMFRWINALCGLALGFFDARILWTTLQDWLEHQILPAVKHGH